MEHYYRVTDDALHLYIKAVPGASKTEFAGIKDKRLRVRIAAAPEGGKANAELCAFLAKALGCARRDIALISGEKSRLKTLAVPREYEGNLHMLFGDMFSCKNKI
jgi:uncharacterized protein (TIGR00251 family)